MSFGSIMKVVNASYQILGMTREEAEKLHLATLGWR
jgi:hypothetical protein